MTSSFVLNLLSAKGRRARGACDASHRVDELEGLEECNGAL
ncbi:MAG: hypothetical protein OXL38_21995 [Gammaproteobacteria bacterium]|nr:hypothetical protein [Gammaproteobacteria bacterium]